MNIESRKIDEILVVKPLVKSIEAINSKDFKTNVIEMINQENKSLILNLSKVEFMDSSGLGSLISILKAINNLDGKFFICEIGEQVKNLLLITCLDKIFHFAYHEEEAISSIKTFNPAKQ